LGFDPNQPPIPEEDVQDTVIVTGHRVNGLTYDEFMQRYGWLFDNSFELPVLGLGGGGSAAQDGEGEETPVCAMATASLNQRMSEFITALNALAAAETSGSGNSLQVPGADAFERNLPTVIGMRDFGTSLIFSEMNDDAKILQVQLFVDRAREAAEEAQDVADRACSGTD